MAKAPAAATVTTPHLTKPISTSLSGAFIFLASAMDRQQSPHVGFYSLTGAAAYDRTDATVRLTTRDAIFLTLDERPQTDNENFAANVNDFVAPPP
jgi:hypothetical protein